MSKSPPITIKSEKLRACVEVLLGGKIPDNLWKHAEQFARYKLDLNRPGSGSPVHQSVGVLLTTSPYRVMIPSSASSELATMFQNLPAFVEGAGAGPLNLTPMMSGRSAVLPLCAWALTW